MTSNGLYGFIGSIKISKPHEPDQEWATPAAHLLSISDQHDFESAKVILSLLPSQEKNCQQATQG